MNFNARQVFEILILVTSIGGFSFVVIYKRVDDTFRPQIVYKLSQTLKTNIRQQRGFLKSVVVSSIKDNFKSHRRSINNDLTSSLMGVRNKSKCSKLPSQFASEKQAKRKQLTQQNNISDYAGTLHSRLHGNFSLRDSIYHTGHPLLQKGSSFQIPSFTLLQLSPPKSSGSKNDTKNLDEEKEFMKVMKARMKSRQEHMKKICKEQGLIDQMEEVRRDTYYLEDLNIYFCHVPKTGSKHWNKMLFDADTSLRNKHSSSFKKERFNFHSMKVRYGAKNISQVLKKNVLKIMVVREPFERLLSAYRDKLSENPKDTLVKWSHFIHQQYSGKNIQETANFSEFVAYMVDKRFYVGKLNLHWRKYRTLCQPCAINYDIIGHQETIDEDARYLLKLIGAPDDVKLLPAEHPPTDSALVRKYYQNVKPKENLFKLYELYKDDFMLFDYDVTEVLAHL